jgi:peptidoglycan/LPS O-acetylase OafA/YrhL
MAGKLIFFGGTGIHLFILLSGFGLYYSYIHKPVRFKEFITRRISKVYLPYIFIVLISAFIALFVPVYKGSLYALGGHVFLYKMFDESIVGSYGYPLWFISMIIQFYLMFFPLAWLKSKMKSQYFLILGFIISFIWIIFIILTGKDVFRVWNSFFLKYLWEFVLGMYLAEKFTKNNYKFTVNFRTRSFFIIGIAGCILYALMALKLGIAGKMLNDVPALLGYSFLAIWIYQLSIKYINAFIFYIGKISYSLYLLHTLVIVLVMYFMPDVWHPLLLLISFVLSVLLAGYYQKLMNFTLK